MRFHLVTSIDDERPVFIAGNFNDWKTNDVRFQMQKVGIGIYQLDFNSSNYNIESLEYKYVKGGWEHSELDEYGSKTPNRIVALHKENIHDFVPRWRWHGYSYQSKFLPKIQLLSEAFTIPQLNRERRVHVLLPHDYYETERYYPVLYLQDGQNLFDEHAPFGNWEIDKKMAVLAESGKGNVIIVAIDHGENERITEYTPISSIRLGIGKGEGAKYIQFMKDSLKPYIDTHYRTLSDSKNTGVGGSSMGGLISMYAGLMFPETFGRLMVFSPSLWIYPDIYQEASTKYSIRDTKIYLYGGAMESETMVSNIEKLHEALRKSHHHNNQINVVINPIGIHNEAMWSTEFPRAVVWLFLSEYETMS